MSPRALQQLRGRLAAIVGIAKRTWLFMQLCSPADYHKAGSAASDLLTVERKVDVFVEVQSMGSWSQSAFLVAESIVSFGSC